MNRLVAAVIAALLACAPAAAQNVLTLPNAQALTGGELITTLQGSGCAAHTTPCGLVSMTPTQLATYLGGTFSRTGTDPTFAKLTGATFTGAIAAANFSGSSSGSNTGDQTITLTGDVTGGGTGSFPATLATVNSAPGSCGSSGGLAVPLPIINGKGLVTSCATYALGAAAGYNVGTAGGVLGLLNGSNTYSGAMTFTQPIGGSVTGNAGTATKLATARTINGVAFDGSANITVNAADSVARLAAASNLSDVASSQASTANLGSTWAVCKSGAPASVTGTMSETTLATCTIPAGAIGANGFVEVISHYTFTASMNLKTVKLRLSGTELNSVSASSTTSPGFRMLQSFNNAGSQSSQFATQGAGAGASGVVYRTSVNTTAATTLTITCTLVMASETCTLENYLVRLTFGA